MERLKLDCGHRVKLEEYKLAKKCPKCNHIIFFKCHFCKKLSLAIICPDCKLEAIVYCGNIKYKKFNKSKRKKRR